MSAYRRISVQSIIFAIILMVPMIAIVILDLKVLTAVALMWTNAEMSVTTPVRKRSSHPRIQHTSKRDECNKEIW